MNNVSGFNLDKKIEELRFLTKGVSVVDVSIHLFSQLMMFSNSDFRGELTSPARQSLYLLGIMASQKDCEKQPLTDDEYKKIATLLNDIFQSYMRVYFPSKEQLKDKVNGDWIQSHKTSMAVFLGYFFEGKKIATDELMKDVFETNEDFDSKIEEAFGVSLKSMLGIFEGISDLLQSRIDRIQEVVSELDKLRMAFVGSGSDDYYEKLEQVKDAGSALTKEFQDLTAKLGSFKFDDLKGFPEKEIECFKKVFVTNRGGAGEIKYITEDSVVVKSPLVTEDSVNFILPSVNFLLNAIQIQIEDFFKTSKEAERYRRARDLKLEQDTKKAFEELMPSGTSILESVFENDKSTNEHDLVIFYERKILIIESKASPRREPLRDPTKAFTRIRDDFHKKTGIQSGYSQASNLKCLIESKEETKLYNKKGDLIFTILREDYDDIYCICVTKDDFGLLATDLSLLLDLKEGDSYPWVINIHDLKYYFSCLKYISKDFDYILEYLDFRKATMGRITATDELEIAGAYLKYHDMKDIDLSDANLMLTIDESNVFDEIHMAKSQGVPFQLIQKEAGFKLFKSGRENIKKKSNSSAKKKSAAQKKARRKNRRSK